MALNPESRQHIDAQFDRAVEIVQSLPKNGPIQTGYEEKLTMYRYQATVGNVQPPRPSVWDMLGRAKWDAWAKHKDLDPYEAKWLYVDALLKVNAPCNKGTRDLVRELESFNKDPSSWSTTRSALSSSASSASASSEDLPLGHSHTSLLDPQQPSLEQPVDTDEDQSVESHDADEDRDHLAPQPPSAYAHSQLNRPQSSLSSHRYRTPMAGSTLLSPPPMPMSVPAMQPLPGSHAQSVFAESASSYPSGAYPASTTSYPEPLSQPSPSQLRAPGYRRYSSPRPSLPGQYARAPLAPFPSGNPNLERAVETVQGHLAALTERLEVLEQIAHKSTISLSVLSPTRGLTQAALAGQDDEDRAKWDPDDMGMWALVLNPLSRTVGMFSQLVKFVTQNERRSPTLVVIRRLFLDISFMLCFLAATKLIWKRSGVRRKEVSAALKGLGYAIVGQKRPRVLVDRAV
ncbi:ACBP-domain-containing protein [Obba rivulosa]|uniref:ACBP-domain-containing protein n=1 Tax=Obba rivulosa TaxID=1052685 RepID=A0A8E2DU86_9APHY|nr:ACBP-domain-containing protein [Obba rivulosa]